MPLFHLCRSAQIPERDSQACVHRFSAFLKYRSRYTVTVILVVLFVASSASARLVDLPPLDLEIAESRAPTPPKPKSVQPSKPQEAAPAKQSGVSAPDDDNFLIVEVRLNDFQLAEALALSEETHL